MNESYVQEYRDVLDGKKAWDKFFFQSSAQQKAKDIMTYLLKDVLSLRSYEEAKPLLNAEFVSKYCLTPIAKLTPMPEMLPDEFYYLAWYVWPEHEMSADELTLKAYKDVLSGKRKTFPSKYFAKSIDPEHRAVVCFRYLCEEVLGLHGKDAILSVFGNSSGIKVLIQYKLKIVLNIVFPSLSHLLYAAYPDVFSESKPEEKAGA